MLRFNTFRAKRYLRSKFVEGKYLLASEATDLELEILDVLRKTVQNALGDSVAVGDAWKVERLSPTEILIKPGEAWVKGLPYNLRDGKDQLVSGAILSLGTVPVGVTASDESDGLGKVLTFNDGATTPSNTYRITVSASEELITDVDDPFLKNANLTESTSQKIRLLFRLNIVPVSLQTESPLPYRDDTGTSLVATNFPGTGGFASPNLQNNTVVTPSPGGNGELIAINPITGSEGIDGRDLEVVLRNNPALGGGNPLPQSPTSQAAFSNSTLIDSNGNIFYVNAIFNDTISTQIVIRIDKEPDQPNPEIINGKPFTLIKREVFVTDDSNGVPQGKLYWNIADIVFDSTDGFVHGSVVTDLRNVMSKAQEYQDLVNQKLNLYCTDGGVISWDTTVGLTWADDIRLRMPNVQDQIIENTTQMLLNGGCLAYEIDFENGGIIGRGVDNATVSSFGATSSITGVNFDNLRIGNIVKDSLGVVAEITAIDDVNGTITTSPALTANGALACYLDSYALQTAPKLENLYILAVRSGTKVYVGNQLELEDGESSEMGDGVSQQLLDFIGSTGETDDSPNYSSTEYVADGDSLVDAISALDLALFGISGSVGAISWKAPVANFAALPSMGNADGDVRLTLDTRIAYHWDDANTVWKPLTGSGGGIKIMGGGTVSWGSASGGSVFDQTVQDDNATLGPPNSAGQAVGQTFTPSSSGNLDKISVSLRGPAGPYTGNFTLELYATSAGLPTGVALATSNTFDASVLNNTQTMYDFVFPSNPSLISGTKYAWVLETGTFSGSGNVFIGYTNVNVIATENFLTRSVMASPYSPQTDKTFTFEVFTTGGYELSFTNDMYLEMKGLDYSDNTILTSESPISFVDDQTVAYVIANVSAGGGPLSVVVDTLPNTPINAVILARVDGNEVVVGTSSTRLRLGQSSSLYDQTSNQTLQYIGAGGTAVDAPTYSSDIRGSVNESLTERLGVLTHAMGDAQEDRSAILYSQGMVSWTTNNVRFTQDLVINIVNTKSGTQSTHVIQASNSPIAIAAGQSIWARIDRTATSENLTIFNSNVTPIPAQSEADKDVVILFKRLDVGGDYTTEELFIPLARQSVIAGQRFRIGQATPELDITTVNSNITLVYNRTYLVDSTAPRTLTLPPPIINTFIKVKDTGNASANNITVNRNSTDLVDGATSDVISSDYASRIYISNGTNWYIL